MANEIFRMCVSANAFFFFEILDIINSRSKFEIVLLIQFFLRSFCEII
jgi:hypothetical protein